MSEITNPEVKNLIRGIIAQNTARTVEIERLNALRREASEDDLATCVRLLTGKTGAFPFSNIGGTYRDLVKTHGLTSISPTAEVAFVAGHVNGWEDEAIGILASLSALAALPSADPTDAMNALLLFAKRWGASNLLAKKIAYISANSRDDISDPFDSISDLVGHSKYSIPYFTALESIDPDFPYFSSMHTRVQVCRKHVDSDLRQVLPLHNVVASPINPDDLSSFLRKVTSMSLVDELVGLLQLLHCRDTFPWVVPLLKRLVTPRLFNSMSQFSLTSFDTSCLIIDSEDGADTTYYRSSLAFLEFAEPCQYRHYVDRIVGPRLLRSYLAQSSDYPKGNHTDNASKRRLTKSCFGFRRHGDHNTDQNVGRFLRTVQFLQYLDSKPNLSQLTHFDVRHIFENTTSLDILLSTQELEQLYNSVDDDSKPIVSVLAMALHKARAHSDDVDFKFRFFLSSTINSRFQGRLEAFIEWLVVPNPQIANYMVGVLDRTTLQKMYWIFSSASDADRARMSILQIVGRALGRIEYFVEADAIEAQRQVSSLRQFFDDSRIFVDGVAMKQWLVEHPSSYAQQYSRLLDHVSDSYPATLLTRQDDGSTKQTHTEVSLSLVHDYILLELVKIVFEQFCLNVTFGIESYLSRRIRHNTMSGMMRSGVDTVIDRPQFRSLYFDRTFESQYNTWLDNYRALIETIRTEYLQFRSQSKPKGLFSSEIKPTEEPTLSNIAVLRKTAWAARGGHDLMNELLIRFCWREIDPQLDQAAKFLTGELLQRANALIDEYFSHHSSSLAAQFESSLRSEVHNRFHRLASWFRQPESGFVKATPRQLGDMILMEAVGESSSHRLDWSGDAVDEYMDGLSVHRVYDCLSVLIRNAVKYSSSESISVSVENIPAFLANIAKFHFTVGSLLPLEEREEHLARLRETFSDDDIGHSMVREGYSGIKKLRFIVSQSEGSSDSYFKVNGEICEVGFSLTVERPSDGKP